MPASVKVLLSSVVDYAGLFPPAKLGIREAMMNYAKAQMAPYAWMLGRFVLPASRLDEFEALLPQLEESKTSQWSLSVLLSQEMETEIERVRSLNNPNIAISALEIPPLLPTEIERVFPCLPTGVDLFFEIPLHKGLEAYVSVLQKIDASAKVRTGGLTAEAFPSVTQLCQCICAFAEARVPFKATAGLHHPLPAEYRLTYEPDSPSSKMHGFLNVTILAALVYWQKVTPEEALAILEESSINKFQYREDGIDWSNYQLNFLEIETARQQFFRSFGSCSFEEPIHDLKNLNLLG
ncbi:MAG TPA: hypothetical protein V6C93_23905 [Allocoleopsis sp.]